MGQQHLTNNPKLLLNSKGTKGIQCWQLNLHHCQSASYNLAKELGKCSGRESNIALLQEPWHVKGQVRSLPRGMKLFSNSESNGPTRACVLLSNKLNAWGLPHLSNRDIAAARVEGLYYKWQNQTLVLASIYMSHADTALPPRVEELVSYCEKQRLSLIVGADANLHHVAWESTGTNSRREQLLIFLISTNLAWYNTGHKPTYELEIGRKY